MTNLLFPSLYFAVVVAGYDPWRTIQLHGRRVSHLTHSQQTYVHDHVHTCYGHIHTCFGHIHMYVMAKCKGSNSYFKSPNNIILAFFLCCFNTQ